VKVNRLLLRDLSVVGVALAPYAERHPEIVRTLNDALELMAAAGHLTPLVGQCLPLEQGAEALGLIERRAALGKVVVEVRPAGSAGDADSPSRRADRTERNG
jgi:NADPH:quinone reductase